MQRRARKSGRPFWGCANYPECEFLVNTEPLKAPCPDCGGMLVAAARGRARCTDCKWKGDPPAVENADTTPAAPPELAGVGG